MVIRITASIAGPRLEKTADIALQSVGTPITVFAPHELFEYITKKDGCSVDQVRPLGAPVSVLSFAFVITLIPSKSQPSGHSPSGNLRVVEKASSM